MTIFELTKENVNELPLIEWQGKDDDLYDGIVIVPKDETHDSGYQRMQFVFCHGHDACKRVDRGSDVLHLDGIGGYGEFLGIMRVPNRVRPRDWSIDCTPNGYLRIFSGRYGIKVGDGINSFSVYAIEKERKNA